MSGSHRAAHRENGARYVHHNRGGAHSDTRWTVVRGSDIEEGESQGLPAWSQDVGDAVLDSNRTRRVDFALFMVEALNNDDLVQATRIATSGLWLRDAGRNPQPVMPRLRFTVQAGEGRCGQLASV
jgi:hypothetical protein